MDHQNDERHLETLNEAIPQLITTLSTVLERAANSNNQQHQKVVLSAFHGLTRPTISILNYLERIFKYANCSSSCYVVAYVYLDRFTQRHPLIPINSFNVHRLVITSVMVAAKFMDDLYYNNAYYAKIGGITTAEINFLELDFLFGLGFNLNVTPNTFNAYCYHLQREMLLHQLQSPLSSSSLDQHHHIQVESTTTTSHLTTSSSSSNNNTYSNTVVVIPKFQSCFISDDQDDSSSTHPQLQQHYLAV